QDDDKDVKTILKYLSKNYGDWPILTNRDPGEKFEWSEMVADLNRIGRPGLTPLVFKVAIERDMFGGILKLQIGQTTFLNNTLVYLPVDTVMKILEATEKADKRAVANVLNFQFASQLLLESTVLLDDLSTSRCSETDSIPRELWCLESAKIIFGYSLGTTYLKVYYNDDITTPAVLKEVSFRNHFSVSTPGFMNFGGLGMVLSHEIGHSFDQFGRQFDKNGKLGEYWDATSKKKYEEWVESINQDAGNVVYQMSETSAETLKPDQTTDENIADALGVQISFLAYKEYLKELEKNGQHEKRLPGLKTFPPDKLFFMKYANMWCEDKDVQLQYFFLLQSVHSAGNTRATLPLKRSKQFAETFGCKMPKQH
ncbi:Neprilysin-1, partial [Orchesella cincta]